MILWFLWWFTIENHTRHVWNYACCSVVTDLVCAGKSQSLPWIISVSGSWLSLSWVCPSVSHPSLCPDSSLPAATPSSSSSSSFSQVPGWQYSLWSLNAHRCCVVHTKIQLWEEGEKKKIELAKKKKEKMHLLSTEHLVSKHLENPKAYARLLFVDFSSAFNTQQPHVLLNLNSYSLDQWRFCLSENNAAPLTISGTTHFWPTTPSRSGGTGCCLMVPSPVHSVH